MSASDLDRADRATRIIVTWRIEMQTVMEHGHVYLVPRLVMGPMRTERICVPDRQCS